jgi:septal ring factor EnvC (AmiA/AmiB activator)
MTKDEIKKALECCEKYAYCKDCPCYTYCEHELHKGALALITEQEKEIDFQVQDRARLQREIDELEQAHEQRVEEIKRLEAEVKRAKINAMLELEEKIVEHMGEREYMGVKYKQGVFSESEIDEFIQEVQDGEDKG